MYEKSGPGDDGEAEREPWRFPPENELPAVVPIERFLVRTASVVGIVIAAEAYSTGCLFRLRFAIQRGDRDEESWQMTCRRAVSHPHLYPPTSQAENDSGLKVTVTTATGDSTDTQASVPLVDRGRPGPPSEPVLALHNVRSSSDRSRAHVTADLWLWPLPPPGELTLSATWESFALTSAELTIDASTITEAATRIQHF